MAQPITDELRQMERTFAEAMPGYHLVDLWLPSDLFDRLLAELALTDFRREPSRFLPFKLDKVCIGSLIVQRRK